MPAAQGRPPNRRPADKSSSGSRTVETQEGHKNWGTIPAQEMDLVSAAFEAGGMSAELTRRVERVFAPVQRRLTLVPRIDMRGITCRARRTDQRPRERRASHGRRRRTSTSRDDGSPAGSDEPALGRRTVYTFGLDGYREATR